MFFGSLTLSVQKLAPNDLDLFPSFVISWMESARENKYIVSWTNFSSIRYGTKVKILVASLGYGLGSKMVTKTENGSKCMVPFDQFF